ncbi:hypothetical protein [Maritalea sp.]|uniref:hypothetical protein n=1 Tax=Maritalea sp. TaxID=2003361 RepID=UPI003EFA7BE0
MQNHLAKISLEPDCKNCAAYCCVALAFDKSAMFAYDKQATEPCKHLDDQHACAIHDSLDDQGFRGCIRYNCFGAGQRVTNQIFDGRSWRDHPDESQEMFDAYRAMHKVHEFLAMLMEVRKLKLNAAQFAQVEAFETELTPLEKWTSATLIAYETCGTFEEIGSFFKGLGDRV